MEAAMTDTEFDKGGKYESTSASRRRGSWRATKGMRANVADYKDLWTGPVPDDIKCDIAKTVRSIDWTVVRDDPYPFRNGLCFFRNVTGMVTLWKLGIAATLALGGMIYRAGPDEYRDVMAFCGPGNAGTKLPGGLLGHYFIISGDDIVDFSPGDWKQDAGAL